MSTVKEQAADVVDKLPEGATWDDVMHAIYVRQKFEAGVKAGQEGRVMSHQDVKNRYASRP